MTRLSPPPGKKIFYLSDTGNNRVLKIEVDNVPVGSMFCSISRLNYLGLVDIHTGVAARSLGI